MKFISILLLATFFGGCYSKLLVQPIPCNKFVDCTETIKRIYTSQKPRYAPVFIDVTSKYISFRKESDQMNLGTGFISTRNRQYTIYFKDIRNLRVIHYSNGEYVIRFTNSASRSDNKIILYDETNATEGYSAIQCMMERAKNDTIKIY